MSGSPLYLKMIRGNTETYRFLCCSDALTGQLYDLTPVSEMVLVAERGAMRVVKKLSLDDIVLETEMDPVLEVDVLAAAKVIFTPAETRLFAPTYPTRFELEARFPTAGERTIVEGFFAATGGTNNDG